VRKFLKRESIEKFFKLITLFSIVIFSYAWGAYSYPRGLWPIDWLREVKHSIQSTQGEASQVDKLGRFIDSESKTRVPCPQQAPNTVVLLVAGQSNAANHAEKKWVSKHAGRALNFWQGHCYLASSPILGATGLEGEYLTLLSDILLDSQKVDAVVIVSLAVTGTPISRWQAGGDLNKLLLSNLESLTPYYKVTDVVWHQGESDYANQTGKERYVLSFDSLRDSLRSAHVQAPIWLVAASRCGFDAYWHSGNAIAQAHQQLPQQATQVQLAISTDTVFEAKDRRSDHCHLSENGQIKVAHALAQSILNHRFKASN
jgi:Carbohydrate esterase, sialic acid-specific acetylesterase